MLKYFIKRGSENWSDTYETYKIYVISSKGLADNATLKDEHVEDWADKNGQEVYERLAKVYKPQDVTIDFIAVGDIDDVKTNVSSFLTYLKTVIPAFENAEYGSSKFLIKNDMWNEEKTLRYLGFNDGAELMYDNVIDNQDTSKIVSGWKFTLNFVIDKPTK